MDERIAADSDELLRMIMEDELEDQAATQQYMAINDYARLRGTTPQRVYYYIRNRKLQKVKCACGRFVVHIHSADLALGYAKEEKDEG
jgi:hypothetical protein